MRKTTTREPVRKYPRACIDISLACNLRNWLPSISQEPLIPAAMGHDKPYPLRHALANGQLPQMSVDLHESPLK